MGWLPLDTTDDGVGSQFLESKLRSITGDVQNLAWVWFEAPPERLLPLGVL
jgi:hypothetical protein